MSGPDAERPAPDGSTTKHGLPELIAERRAKGERLRESAPAAFPYPYEGVEPIADVLGAYEHLQPGEETEDKHRVAGRLAARRGSGGAAFPDVVRRTGPL